MAEPAKEVVKSSADQEKAESIAFRNVELEVQSFLNHFRVAYERGDRDGLFALCASADTDSRRMNIERLQKDRGQMFKYNKIRYFINNVGFQDAGEMIIVSGEYRIEGSDDKDNDKDVDAIFRGDIRWSLVREDGNLKIAEIEYD